MEQSLKIKIVLVLVFSVIFIKAGDLKLPLPYNSGAGKSGSYLKFNIVPPQARFYYDGKIIFPSDSTIKVVPGKHHILVRAKKYHDMDFELDVPAGDTLFRNITLFPLSGSLRITVPDSRSECHILRDGKEISHWQGCGGLNKVMIGKYVVRIVSENYSLYDTITVTENNVITKKYSKNEIKSGRSAKNFDSCKNLIRKSYFIRLMGGYSVYGSSYNNLNGDVSFGREIAMRSHSLEIGLNAYYYSPYIYRHSEEIHMDYQVPDFALGLLTARWKGRAPGSLLGIAYRFSAGARYAYDDNRFQGYYECPLFYLCPSIVLGDSLAELSIRPYTENYADNHVRCCDLSLSFNLDKYLHLYISAKCMFENDYIPSNVIVFAGTKINFGIKEKVQDIKNTSGGHLCILPAVDYIVCNDGIWSQGAGMSLFAAYAMTGGIRLGAEFSVCTNKINSDFNYAYEADLRFDSPLIINTKNYITPSLKCGLSNYSYAGDAGMEPIVAAALMYERHFVSGQFFLLGVAVPATFSELQDIQSFSLSTVKLQFGYGVDI